MSYQFCPKMSKFCKDARIFFYSRATSAFRSSDPRQVRLSKISLLRRLQAQTLPDEASPLGKIAVTFECDLDALQDLESP